MTSPEYAVSDFVAACNQILDVSFGVTTIYGELANFKISKNKWVYFDLKDETAKVRFFGNIYALPGPIEDGMVVTVVGRPSLHPQYGFSVQVQSITPKGEGSIKKAATLLEQKLAKEGLFAVERKRSLPRFPSSLGLITSDESAAYSDFIKVLSNRWPLTSIVLANTTVQGDSAVPQIVTAINSLNSSYDGLDAIVIIRGGGSPDELDVFNNELVVRSVASSRVPTLVAIGHERDVSLAERAADVHASTPSNAAEMIAPSMEDSRRELADRRKFAASQATARLEQYAQYLQHKKLSLHEQINVIVEKYQHRLQNQKETLKLLHPESVLKRGYTIIRHGKATVITRAKQAKQNADMQVQFFDGTIKVHLRKEE